MAAGIGAGTTCKGLDELIEEQEKSQLAADGAKADAEKKAQEAAALKQIVDQLKPIVGPYGDARRARKADVDDLDKRLAALLKSLVCNVAEDCRNALDAAIKQHPITVDAAAACVDTIEHCHDTDSIPGHETECAVHAGASAKAAADLTAIMSEATALGQRIDALKAEIDSIEKASCPPDAELSKSYVRYTRATCRLDDIYNGVGECGGDFDEALVQRICELRNDAAAKEQAKKDCDTKLGELKAELEAKKKQLTDLTANEGIDDIICTAGAACP